MQAFYASPQQIFDSQKCYNPLQPKGFPFFIQALDRKLCFVLMPFRGELELVYDQIKKIVQEEHHMSCMRADNIFSDGIVVEEIWQSICKAQIVIADATGRNANVFYEMGLSHGIGKSLIIITQSINDIPFDLQHRRVIIYDINNLWTLREPLSKTVEKLKWVPPAIKEWIDTNRSEVKIGLATPTDGQHVAESPIEALGRTVGIPENRLQYVIQGFIITDKEYQQGSGWIDKEGYWRINELHLGASVHKLFFRIFDETGCLYAKSKSIKVFKEVSH